LPDFYLFKTSFIVGSDGFFIAAALISIDYLGTAILTDGFMQELMGSVLVPSFDEQKINGITFLIYSPI